MAGKTFRLVRSVDGWWGTTTR